MNFISRIIKSINAMRERLKIERHEAMYGPHFNEECALKAVSKMENEDGSRGEHWSLEETTSIANQYGINLKGEKYNKYDWYVALNMIRSDYYRAVVTMTSSDHIKYFVELAKAWLNDKDIEEGKMWYYYCYIMCDKLRKEAKTMLMLEDDEDEEHEYRFPATGSETFVVSINPNSTQNTTVATTGIPLIGSTGVQLTSADVINGNRLLVYFNKCEGIFQVVNHIPTTTA